MEWHFHGKLAFHIQHLMSSLFKWAVADSAHATKHRSILANLAMFIIN